MKIRNRRVFVAALSALSAAFLAQVAESQSLSSLRKIDVEAGRAMIATLREELPKNFYDSSYRGVDVAAAFNAAEQKLAQAQTLAHVYGIVAAPLLSLNDPHTFFVPPPRNVRVDFGFQVKMVGDQCLVTAVSPFSEAAKKGLKVGDTVVKWNGFPPSRRFLWKLIYLSYVVRPNETPHLDVLSPDGQPKVIDAKPKVTKNVMVLKYDATSNGRIDTKNLINWVVDEARMRKQRFHEEGNDLIIWECPHFDFEENMLHGFMGSVRKRSLLIMDLRSNVGGREEIFEKLAGYFFDKEVKIADFQGRKQIDPLTAQSQGQAGFKGKVVVIVDHATSGAAELFARLLQIHKRGTVIGDGTAGAVLRARMYRYDLGENPFAASISEGVPVMSDGQTLEGVGVTPDELLLPKGQELASGSDPLLSRAAALLGVAIDPAAAGKIFPIEWYRDLLKE
jgi:C-terminal processing protease CtpA/Prc